MNRAMTVIVWAGGLALLAATAIDTLAALGRHVGLPLRGSIELIQPAILVANCIAILAATIAGAHARAILLIERLGAAARWLADAVNELLTALLYLLILAGSVWIAIDLWGAFEVSEIAGVPWRWMRLAANALLLLSAVAALARLRRRTTP